MAQARSPILGVAEIVLNVQDLGRMQKFYQEVLGFRFHSQFPESDPTIVFLRMGDSGTPLSQGGHPQLFALIDARRHLFTRDSYTGIDHAKSSLNHLAFEIALSDYEGERQRLCGLGLEVNTMIFPQMSARALFFHDPEGNHLELICHDAAVQGEQVFKVEQDSPD